MGLCCIFLGIKIAQKELWYFLVNLPWKFCICDYIFSNYGDLFYLYLKNSWKILKIGTIVLNLKKMLHSSRTTVHGYEGIQHCG